MKKHDEIDALIAWYEEHMPKTVCLVRHKERYPALEQAARAIRDLALRCDKDAEVKIGPDPLVGTMLCVEIKANLFVVDCMDEFLAALRMAQTIDICPLVDGRVSIGLTFPDAWVPAPAYGTPEAIAHNQKAREQKKQRK